jgi:DNA-binding PadR family transcriptional regulator
MPHFGSDSLFEQEQLVLLSVLRLGHQAYGVRIVEELNTLASLQVSRPSIYVTLGRLERKGLLTSSLGAPLPQRGGRARRYYQITPAALLLLRDTRQCYLRLWNGLEGVLDGA